MSKRIIVIWALTGVLALLARAIWALAPRAWEAWPRLSGWQIAVTLAWTAFMLVGEGYRGFQKAFSPRVVARARHLAEHPRWYFVILAPAYAMGLLHARPKRLAVSWALVVGIALLVILVSRLAQPWRGMVDTGVVAGLAWGAASILVYAVRRGPIGIDLDLPVTSPSPPSAEASSRA